MLVHNNENILLFITHNASHNNMAASENKQTVQKVNRQTVHTNAVNIHMDQKYR